MPNQPNRTDCVAVMYWLPVELRASLRAIARDRDSSMTDYVTAVLWPHVRADLREIELREIDTAEGAARVQHNKKS